MRRGGPVAGGRGEAVGDHAVEPALDGVELGRGFRGGVEAELLVEQGRAAVAFVALRGGPFFGGECAGRYGRNDPLAVSPLALLGGGIEVGLRCGNPAFALKVGDNRRIGFGAELLV